MGTIGLNFHVDILLEGLRHDQDEHIWCNHHWRRRWRCWIVSLFAIWGTSDIFKTLDTVHLKIIDNMSIGTIVIMGIHFILIGTTNYVLEKTLNIDGKIIYPWYIACVLVVFFEALIYPIILLFKNKYTFMLGKR